MADARAASQQRQQICAILRPQVTDIYATANNYDVAATATQRFFATVQNKLHWTIHGLTAAEVILNRANAEKTHMGLTT